MVACPSAAGVDAYSIAEVVVDAYTAAVVRVEVVAGNGMEAADSTAENAVAADAWLKAVVANEMEAAMTG